MKRATNQLGKIITTIRATAAYKRQRLNENTTADSLKNISTRFAAATSEITSNPKTRVAKIVNVTDMSIKVLKAPRKT